MVLCTTVVLFSILYFISDVLYLKGFEKLERQSAEENTGRVADALSAKFSALDTLCYDWAAWDDTYEYAQNQNSDFIDTNLGDETFVYTDLNLIIILNSTGQIVYQKAFDLIDLKEIAISDDLQNYLSEGQLIYHSSIEDKTSGIILLSNLPMLTVSRPIVTSHAEGPSTGTIIMGRFLDSGVIDALSETTHLPLTLLPLTYASLPTDLNVAIKASDSTKSIFVKTLSKDSIAGYILVEDLDGAPAFVFQVDMPRLIYAQGQKTLSYLHAYLLFSSVIFCLVLILVFRKTVLTRLAALSNSVNGIGLESNVSRRVSISGKDELSSLAANINGMLESMEKSDAAVRSQKGFIDHILANIPNAILVIDKSQSVILANNAFTRMFGLDTSSLEGMKISSIPILGKLKAELMKFPDGQSSDARTELQYRSNGLYKTLSVSYTRMKEEELLLIIFTDITTERERQERLYLTDRLVSVGEMASGIAHELNNPLSSILGLSELLTEEDLPDNIREDVTTLNSEAQRAAGIVKNMLSFTRNHASVKQPTQMNKVVDDVLKLRAYYRMVNNITVECKLDPELPEIMADYFQMQQVLLNIVLNAEQVMAESHGKGTLKITSEKVGGMVRLSFSDDGPGIAQENLSRVFDPFFTTKEVGKGTGLGLSICYGIVTAHNGLIYAQSDIGKGATFIVELPIEYSPAKEALDGKQ